MEPLETRQMLSTGPVPPAGSTAASSHPALAAHARATAPRNSDSALLQAADVRRILAAAASQAKPGQAIVVVDREGFILGIFAMRGATSDTMVKAAARARTAAFFQSQEEAFTTRTARFIIQDHFPQPLPNTPGGPLYGVQFSSLRGTDVLSAQQTPGISGDPGGIPLYRGGLPAGGVGVAGDGHDIAPREDLLPHAGAPKDNPRREVFNGREESDFDEAVALAGAQGYMAAPGIQANTVFIAGLRLPFTANEPATGRPRRTLAQLTAAGLGALSASAALAKPAPDIVPAAPNRFPSATFGGARGEIVNPIVPSNDPQSDRLTVKDIRTIIAEACAQALRTRAGIRQPLGTHAVVHVAVTDRDGDILGVFRMNDGTRFSYDVAVQKARTAAFFSDNSHAFSTRAIGFVSQRFFPAGLDNGITGPLFHLQNALSAPANLTGPLKDGITIFPGGEPLYKNGHRVGAVGVSGDGVDQDDIISYAGTAGYRPPDAIRDDKLSSAQNVAFLKQRVQAIDATFSVSQSLIDIIQRRLDIGLEGVRLPYVKFPRNPETP